MKALLSRILAPYREIKFLTDERDQALAFCHFYEQQAKSHQDDNERLAERLRLERIARHNAEMELAQVRQQMVRW